jgi:hypothetical protein
MDCGSYAFVRFASSMSDWLEIYLPLEFIMKGQTPLQFAASRGHDAVYRLMLEHPGIEALTA